MIYLGFPATGKPAVYQSMQRRRVRRLYPDGRHTAISCSEQGLLQDGKRMAAVLSQTR